MEHKKLQDILNEAPGFSVSADGAIEKALAGFDKKIIVLDDDPTGVQTVHDIPVYTAWDEESIEQGFADPGMFFILTNSRGVSAKEAERLNRDIAERVLSAAKKSGKDFVFISRSDSTLRGYYPLETATLRDVLEKDGKTVDGEIICPFFIEGGRYAYGNIHYVLYGNELIPAGETEFAKDKSFGYKASDLTEWVEEKTGGAYKQEDVAAIDLETIRTDGQNAIADKLMGIRNFGKVIVNALSYDDIKLFLAGYIEATKRGKHFIFRSAAAIPKVIGGVGDQPLLEKDKLVAGNENGGLIVIGSHVEKTTKQLEGLLAKTDIEPIEFDQHLVLDEAAFKKERARVQQIANERIARGKDVVIYTRRERIDLNTGNPEDELRLSRAISDAVTAFVTNLDVQPAYIIAKGGITSSDIGTTALRAKRAMVMGQVLPGIPVWQLGDESKFPGMAYIIFPGNVGGEDALKVIVEKLR